MTGSQPLVVHITGARPNFPKAAPVISALGELPGRRAVLRSGAEPGQELAVSGSLGRSAAGLEILRRGEWPTDVFKGDLSTLSRVRSEVMSRR